LSCAQAGANAQKIIKVEINFLNFMI
jgi:hypothetical protein